MSATTLDGTANPNGNERVVLVYGAGVTGSMFAVRMHDAGHDVSLLARGNRLAALRRHGVQIARGGSPSVRRVPVPVVEHPAGGYDLIAVLVRTHQVDAVLEPLAAVEGDVLFLLNWGGRHDGRRRCPVPCDWATSRSSPTPPPWTPSKFVAISGL